MGLFLASYFLIYGSLNLYFLLKARSAISLGQRSVTAGAVFLIVMVLAPIAVHFLEAAGFYRTARWLALSAYLWSALIFLFFSTGVLLDLLKLIGRFAAAAGMKATPQLGMSQMIQFAIPLSLSLLAISYGFFEASDIKRNRVAVKSAKLPASSGKIVIAQISDLHLGLIVRGRYLSKVKRILDETRPDILLCTGDLVDGQMNRLEGLAEMLAEIKPPLGKYAVLGNHEFYAGAKQSVDFMRRSGFVVLRGEAVAAGDHLSVVGLDDDHARHFGPVSALPEKDLLAGADRSRFTVLMKHRPEIDEASSRLFDLQLSGHTHKGQVFPFSLLTRLFFKYISGMHRLPSGSLLFVSRGTGTWGPPIRILAPPEVTIIEVVPE